MSTATAPPLTWPIREQLVNSLPAIYRSRDNGDLEALLDVFGDLLDEIRATLDQRLADCFPGDPVLAQGDPTLDEDPTPAQTWLLPYFARLVDARLRSPHPAGRRLEVANAIDWRKRKGTLGVVQDIAEAMTGPSRPGDAGREIAIQEGFTRVATTARIGIPILPPAAFGDPDPTAGAGTSPVAAAALPGLPAVFVDLRRCSRAVRCPPDHPQAQTLHFAQPTPVTWRQLNPRGAPCFPGSYEDRSLRTVDIRPTTADRGQAEPRRLLVFVAQPLGFFDARNPLSAAAPQASVTVSDNEQLVGQRIGTLTVNAGTVTLTGCWVDTLELAAGARAVITASAIQTLNAGSVPDGQAVTATDVLLESITAGGPVQLQYCTVLGTTSTTILQASDCIFAGEITVSRPARSCVRYTAVPPDLPSHVPGHANTTATPIFLALPACGHGDPTPQLPGWGQPGCGVLDTATSSAVSRGAEDGGEMGANHGFAYGLEDEAAVTATTEHLPLAVTSALIADQRLLHVPPAIGTSE